MSDWFYYIIITTKNGEDIVLQQMSKKKADEAFEFFVRESFNPSNSTKEVKKVYGKLECQYSNDR